MFVGDLSLSLTGQTGSGSISAVAPSACEIDIDFGVVRLSQQAEAKVTIANKSNTAIALLASTPQLNPEFGVFFERPQILAAGGSTEVVITFQALRPGVATASFALPTDAPPKACDSSSSSAIAVKLTANAVDLKLSIDPQALDFGKTLINHSATGTLLLTNNSSAPIDGITSAVGGANVTEFSVANVPSALPAHGSASVQITYAPLVLRSQSAANVTFTGSAGEKTAVTLLGEPVSSGLVLSPPTLDFGYLNPPKSSIACTTVTNQLGSAITISSLENFADDNGAFATSPVDDANPPLPAQIPVTLDPGASSEVCFSFTPPSPPSDLQFTGQATLVANDPSGTNPVIELAGWGGGPEISCTPTSIDFGQVLDNTVATVPVTCTNVGSPISETNLMLGPPLTTGKVFGAGFDPTINVYPAQGLLPGMSAQIDVHYEPVLISHDTGMLVLSSNGGRGKGVQIPLTGQGLNLTPCQFTIAPAALNFGNLLAGQSSVLSFAIQNLGASACVVRDPSIVAQVTRAFQITSTSLPTDPKSGNIIVPPATPDASSSLVIEVAFDPEALGAYSAQLNFWVSAPSAPNQSIALSGTSEPTCLLAEPAAIDFGTVGSSQQGAPCSSSSRLFSIFNICTTAATLQSFSLQPGEGDTMPQFSAPAGATLPLQLGVGASGLFALTFAPTSVGAHSAQLLVSDGNIESPLSLHGTAAAATIQTDNFVVAPARADILFVMEVSQSSSAQTAILAALPGFLAAAGDVDYRIAVTTDDTDSTVAAAEFGRLLPCPTCSLQGQTPTIVSPLSIPLGSTTADPGKVLSDLYGLVPNNVSSPVNKPFFASLYDALLRAPVPGVDFFRSGAFFAAITDDDAWSDDGSYITSRHGEAWFANFFSLYFPEPYLFTWNYVGPTPTVTGTGLAEPSELPTNVGLMVSTTTGIAANIQDTQWPVALAGIWPLAVAAAAQYPLSSPPPSGASSLSVAVNGEVVPQRDGFGVFNWTYQAGTNTVVFTSNHPVATGDQIALSYPISCQ